MSFVRHGARKVHGDGDSQKTEYGGPRARTGSSHRCSSCNSVRGGSRSFVSRRDTAGVLLSALATKVFYTDSMLLSKKARALLDSEDDPLLAPLPPMQQLSGILDTDYTNTTANHKGQRGSRELTQARAEVALNTLVARPSDLTLVRKDSLVKPPLESLLKGPSPPEVTSKPAVRQCLKFCPAQVGFRSISPLHRSSGTRLNPTVAEGAIRRRWRPPEKLELGSSRHGRRLSATSGIKKRTRGPLP